MLRHVGAEFGSGVDAELAVGAAERERQADVRTILRGLIDRGQAAGQLRADLSPEDLIVAASLLSRPLPGTGDWDRLARRQIDLMISGLAPAAPSTTRPRPG
jgi:hypothetical protein